MDTITNKAPARGRPPLAERLRAPLSGRLRLLFSPVDIAPLVYFRIVFGAIMMWEVARYFDHGWIARYYIEPTTHFTYYGFGWVQPWPGVGMYLHFAGLGVLAFCIAVGWRYRLCSALFFVGFTYVFLLDQTQYLNHFYLIAWVSLLMALLPAHRAGSLDVRRRPALHTATAPAWTLWALRFLIGIVYVYGGIAKINGDWLQGEPMRMWLADSTDFPVLGPYFTEEWLVYLFSYGGLLLDLLVVPMLLWRRTRLAAALLLTAFHLTNAKLFSIGIFPWFMLAAIPIFYPPRWLRLVFLQRRLRRPSATAMPLPSPTVQRLTVGLLAGFVAFHALFPFRHLLYPGNVSWTEEGHNFSWHMKLRDKQANARFLATDKATGMQWYIAPSDYLTERQQRKMSARPDLILQFAHFVAEQYALTGQDVEVRAEVKASLNGRPYYPLIDPSVDLAAQPQTLGPASWITPLP